MGCSHSGLMAVTKNVLTPNQILDRLKDIDGKNEHHESNAKLTQDEIEKIQLSWRLIEDEKEFGLLIMVRLFTAHAHLREKWIFAKDLSTEEEIRANSQLIYHAVKIVQMFTKIISFLNQINQYDFKEIVTLGRNHQSYGVKPHDFEHFEESLIYCLERKINERYFTHKTRLAWKKFYWIVVGKLCEGIYLAEIEELNNSKKADRKSLNKILP